MPAEHLLDGFEPLCRVGRDMDGVVRRCCATDQVGGGGRELTREPSDVIEVGGPPWVDIDAHLPQLIDQAAGGGRRVSRERVGVDE